MKVFGIVMSVVAALAAVAASIFVVVKYGDQIVAWFKKTFGGLFCCEEAEFIEEVTEEEAPVEEVAEEVVEEITDAVADAEFEA